MKLILVLVIGYLLGCIQTPYIVVRLIKKVDIREFGSKNAGASNATRILGFKYGILIGAIDILKAVVSVIVIRLIYGDTPVMVFAAGTACVMGHIYPVFLNFKGGKGVATTIGMLLAVNYVLGIAAILILLTITIITNYVAAGSVTIYILLPIVLLFIKFPMEAVLFSMLISFTGIFKHRGNIKRIMNGNENVIFRR